MTTEAERSRDLAVNGEARLQAILDAAVDAIITIDDGGIVESANPAVERLFGYAPADLIGRNVSMLMPQPHRERHDEYLARYLRTGEARIIGIGREVDGRRRDGTVFPLELALSEVQGGGRRRFTGIMRDIRARKQAEEALRESHARIQAILDTAVDAIITIDEQGIVEIANPAVERLFGYAPADLIGRNISMLMPSPHRERHDEYLARYLSTGEARVIGIGRELEGLRRDGTTFPLELALSEVRGNGRRRFTGIIRDITVRKQAEQALLRADALKDEFLANTSHELRTPLNGIIGIGQSMLDGATGTAERRAAAKPGDGRGQRPPPRQPGQRPARLLQAAPREDRAALPPDRPACPGRPRADRLPGARRQATAAPVQPHPAPGRTGRGR